jgi:hypothetical protein
MKNRNRHAGQSTRKMASKRRRARVWSGLLMVGAVLLILVLVFQYEALGIGTLGLLGLYVLARLIMYYAETRDRRMKKGERRAVRGARAEERIGSILATLGEDYLVIHDVTSPHGNIDHIVISRQDDVFLIETKAHSGRVSVANGRVLINGHEAEKDFIGQALSNTYWLRDTILSEIQAKAWITPVVVFANAFVEPTASVKGVRIINWKYLLNTLHRQAAKGRNSGVWQNREKLQKALSVTRMDSR